MGMPAPFKNSHPTPWIFLDTAASSAVRGEIAPEVKQSEESIKVLSISLESAHSLVQTQFQKKRGIRQW
jgi:hypothetical protein